MARRFVFLHGLEGSGDGHWQRWLETRLRERGEDVAFPDLPDEFDPDPEAWEAAATPALAAPPAPTVLCHSLACLLWLRLAAKATGPLADRVLLVAPPCREDIPQVARFLDHGADADAVIRAARETLIVCSDNDPYCPDGALRRFAEPLEADCEVVAGAGHINTDAGYGPVPLTEEWALL